MTDVDARAGSVARDEPPLGTGTLADVAERLTAYLTRVDRNLSFPNSRPLDAATLILIDRTQSTPKVLLGRRHGGHKFMPGKFVFPGGRVEPRDRAMKSATALDPRVEARLMLGMRRPSRAKARAFALAAIRETFEETGLLLGRIEPEPPPAPEGLWTAFASARVHPDLAEMHFIARAITPPRRLKRFDTRFFAVDAQAIAHRVEGVVGADAELVELVWLPLDEATRLDMPGITNAVLEELAHRIASGLRHDLPVPFYRWVGGRFRREFL